jgi:hypothetical protein
MHLYAEFPGRGVEVLDDHITTTFGRLENSFQATIGALEELALDEQNETVLKGEFVIIGVDSQFEQS